MIVLLKICPNFLLKFVFKILDIPFFNMWSTIKGGSGGESRTGNGRLNFLVGGTKRTPPGDI